MSDDTHKAARGALPWQEGDEPAEARIRRIRGGDTERIAALEAELARVRRVAIAGLEAARITGHHEACSRGTARFGWSCLCGASLHNEAIERAIAEIGGDGDAE